MILATFRSHEHYIPVRFLQQNGAFFPSSHPPNTGLILRVLLCFAAATVSSRLARSLLRRLSRQRAHVLKCLHFMVAEGWLGSQAGLAALDRHDHGVASSLCLTRHAFCSAAPGCSSTCARCDPVAFSGPPRAHLIASILLPSLSFPVFTCSSFVLTASTD